MIIKRLIYLFFILISVFLGSQRLLADSPSLDLLAQKLEAISTVAYDPQLSRLESGQNDPKTRRNENPLTVPHLSAPELGAPSSDGWVSLPRPQQRHFESQGEEDDPSIWTVFSKKLENERFLVRFPEDPAYLHSSEGTFSAQTEKEGMFHRLAISKKSELVSRIEEIISDPLCSVIDVERHSPFLVDLLYKKRGKWVSERLYQTPSHLYLLHTSSALFDEQAHRKFAHSLDVESFISIDKTPSP